MTDYSELKRLAEALLASDDHADFPGWMAASDAFDNATGPAAVLELIAENERLKKFEDWFGRLETCNNSLAESFRVERDQLKAENEALRKDAERYRFIRQFQGFWIRHKHTDLDGSVDGCMATELAADAAMSKDSSHD